MLAPHRAVGTLERLVDCPTDGLKFLKSIGRLDLSAEKIALDSRYKSILAENITARARANLCEVDCSASDLRTVD
jgi:hypothetical protein